jgi:hypothetical protein
MRCSSFRRSSLLLGFGLLLACSSAGRESEPETAIESQPEAPAPIPAPAGDEPRGPTVGAPAPTLALDSLSGEHVRLPVADGTRATVLIFGSFS